MTPKEKAMQLVTNFYIEIYFDFVSNDKWKDPSDNTESKRTKKDAKRCALLCVDEILKLYWSHNIVERDFYKEVKKEIEKL